MNKTILSDSGQVYAFDWQRKTRPDFAIMGDASSRYERVYFEINVYKDNEIFTGTSIGSIEDSDAITARVLEAIKWAEAPSEMIEGIGSRFD